MTTQHATDVRLSPELQADYQQIYNDPARHHTPEWYIAAKGLFAAGLIQEEPSADGEEVRKIADTQTEGQSL